MEAVEFGAEGIFGRSSVDGNHFGAKLGHARNDMVLRDDCEQEHCDYGERGWLDEDSWGEPESESGHEVENAGDYAEVVEASEGDAYDGTGLVTAGERAEKCRGHGEAEIDDRAEPGAECEELHEAENVGHLLGLSQGRDYHRFLGLTVPGGCRCERGISHLSGLVVRRGCINLLRKCVRNGQLNHWFHHTWSPFSPSFPSAKGRVVAEGLTHGSSSLTSTRPEIGVSASSTALTSAVIPSGLESTA